MLASAVLGPPFFFVGGRMVVELWYLLIAAFGALSGFVIVLGMSARD